ncbi:MAG: MBL fold metallo-hydrolase [Clostridia bacterium]
MSAYQETPQGNEKRIEQSQRTSLLFLGTGAADWSHAAPDGSFRRHASVLVDGHLLIDCTHTALEMLSKSGIDFTCISDVLITHSHSDHFALEALYTLQSARRAVGLSALRVYMESGWARQVEPKGLKIITLDVEKSIQVGRYEVTPLAANHTGCYPEETPLHYLFGGKTCSWLYATDGAWLSYRTCKALQQQTLCALVIDATIGEAYATDLRIFEHNSLPMVRMLTEALHQSGCLLPDAPVVLTHLARTLHPSQSDLEAANVAPYVVAYDGLALTIG